MPSRKPGIFIHCLRSTKATEADHVFPRPWYPDSTPQSVQRWTAPSCQYCNRKFGQLEKGLVDSPNWMHRPEIARRSLASKRKLTDRSALAPTRQTANEQSGKNCEGDFVPSFKILGLDGADGTRGIIDRLGDDAKLFSARPAKHVEIPAIQSENGFDSFTICKVQEGSIGQLYP